MAYPAKCRFKGQICDNSHLIFFLQGAVNQHFYACLREIYRPGNQYSQ